MPPPRQTASLHLGSDPQATPGNCSKRLWKIFLKPQDIARHPPNHAPKRIRGHHRQTPPPQAFAPSIQSRIPNRDPKTTVPKATINLR